MGIFDFLKSKKSSSEEYVVKEERKAECPYCHKALDKIPGKKTKCPHCGKFMFVRTRPNDNVRAIVTEEEAEKIEEDWSIKNGTHEYYLANKEKIKKEREILKNRFGKEPTENDIQWSLLQKEMIEHSQKGDWGLYSCSRFNMAEILRKEGKLKEALKIYLEVCYFDLNGPNNTSGYISNEYFLKEFPPFNPSEGAFLAPGIIDRIRKIIKKKGMEISDVKDIFIKHNLLIKKSLKMPASVEKSWKLVEKEILLSQQNSK